MGTKGRPLFTHVCALVTITVSQSFVVCEEPNPELLKITVAAIDANPCISSMDGHSNHFLSLWICSLLRGLFLGCHATLHPKGGSQKTTAKETHGYENKNKEGEGKKTSVKI